jgi:hypothetical protein
MTVGDIDRHYSSTAMVRQRVERLVQTGFLSAEHTRVALTSRGSRFVRIIASLRRFLGDE